MAPETHNNTAIPVTDTPGTDMPVTGGRSGAPRPGEVPGSGTAAAPRGVVSERAAGVQPFRVMDIVARVARKRAQGHDVISLCVGEPGQDAPTAVRRRAAEVVQDGTGSGYRL